MKKIQLILLAWMILNTFLLPGIYMGTVIHDHNWKAPMGIILHGRQFFWISVELLAFIETAALMSACAIAEWRLNGPMGIHPRAK